MQLDRILLPTDFSEASMEALERAVALALRTGAELRIFHVEVLHDHDPVRVERERVVVLDHVAALRRSLGRGGEDAPIGFSSERAVSAYDGIMAEVEQRRPDVIVMATHGGGLLMGSVAERIVGHAPCDVLTCRLHAQGDWPTVAGRIVVPVDFSENSARALHVARAVAGDSQITLVHVVDAPRHPALYRGSVRPPFEIDPGLRERVEAHLRDWAGAPVDAVSVLQGDVCDALLEECRRLAAVLVVVGTRGLRPAAQWMIGSTAERLTRACPAPVLTVR